jgi:hypothetical protein
MSRAKPSPLKPIVSVCGIGLTRSICSLGTIASTLLVPRMNIMAMTGDATSTALRMVRAGFLHSPANIATYSNPLRAPSAIFPKMFRLKAVAAGIAALNGWYSLMVPRRSAMMGTMMSALYVKNCAAPPTFCSHLPTRSPRIDTHVIVTTVAVLTSGVYH